MLCTHVPSGSPGYLLFVSYIRHSTLRLGSFTFAAVELHVPLRGGVVSGVRNIRPGDILFFY